MSETEPQETTHVEDNASEEENIPQSVDSKSSELPSSSEVSQISGSEVLTEKITRLENKQDENTLTPPPKDSEPRCDESSTVPVCSCNGMMFSCFYLCSFNVHIMKV